VKKFLVAIVFAVSFMFSSISHAEDIQLPKVEASPGEQDVGKAISPMKKYQVAPFSGLLLSPKAVAQIMAELDSYDEKVKIVTEKALADDRAASELKLSEMKTRLEADNKLLQSALQSKIDELKIVNDALKKAENKPDVLPWAIGSFAVGAGVALTAVIAIAISLK
jgi:hypothetical protein